MNKKIIAAASAVAITGLASLAILLPSANAATRPHHSRWTPTPAPTTTTPTPAPSTTGTKSVVFSAPFTDTTQWAHGRTSSYPPGTPQTNPNDNKLDSLNTGPAPASRFVATKLANGKWDTDLVTTEGTPGGFQVRPGDELSATVTLYNQIGAWPAIWTWKNGGNEVDAFEYHGDNPRLLELTNHTGSGSGSYVDNKITPGTPFLLTVKFLTSGVEWYVNGALVFKGNGVPSTWSAYLIVNLSVSAGQYHPSPVGIAPLYFDVTGLKVLR